MMSRTLARLRAARRLARRLIKVVQTPAYPSAIGAELHRPWIQQYGIRTVVDVGANEGQFARLARAALPTSQIFSFEPLPECFAKLQAQFGGDRHFEAFPFALGASPAELTIYRSAYSPSSSLLRMGATHRRAFPHTTDVDEVRVHVETLDAVLGGCPLDGHVLLKLDVQGFEAAVLQGARETLQRVSLVLVELSLEPLYEGEPLFDDVYRQLTSAGFTLRGVVDMLRQPSDGRPLQVDALFEVRR